MTPRRIEADGAMPGGWLLRGAAMAVPDGAGGVWATLHPILAADPETACLRCGTVTLSRGEVLAAVERIASLPHGCRVGLHFPRSPASVILTLAIWRNGGAYVPIAPEYPLAAVAAMTATCDLDVVVADRRLDLPNHPLVTTDAVHGVPAFFHARADVASVRLSDQVLCYVAHTSGSTGAPKAVMVSHANLLNRLACMQRILSVGPRDRVLYKTSAVFDVHVWELTLALAFGGVVVIAPQTRYFDLPEVARIIVAEGVTVAGFVPALLRPLLELTGFVAGNRLRAVFCGGEGWGVGLARDFYDRLPGCALYNSYGPAETTLAVANWQVPDDPSLEQIYLGDPLPNLAFLIEDSPGDNGQGVGPLCIGGAQVALGYIGDRGRNRFFERVVDGEMVRFYRTGDLVKLDFAAGSLQFRGRDDRQVKVNGMRIELDEIEDAIRKLPGVQSCVAFVARTGAGAQLCAAYETTAARPIAAADVRRGCARSLPALHVPSRLHQVDGFPLTPSGKIDRAAVIARCDAARVETP